MAKEVIGFIKLQVPAGGANPSPPIGPALGQKGLNIMEFCKQFNAKTQQMEKGIPVPVVITAFSDRSFTFVTKTPPNSYFVMKAAKIAKGSSTVGLNTVGNITMDQVREIAKTKMPDLNCHTIEAAMQQVIGTARSMGVTVSEK
ncbi:MAG: 50S ribosomal protein L11 [Alphaproteobacteria bacterium]|nr:50S ribosomal protein L11 [Alphaproteobacteria bacterium]